jgi:hypothetical protein
VIEHWCEDRWRPGAITECSVSHRRRGRAPNVTPYNQRTNTVTEGVASTGQISPKGTVAHREHFDGRVDAHANVQPVTVKLSELRRNE